MTTAADWTALAVRAEQATGADRGLDSAVWYLAVEKPRPGDKIDQDMLNRWPAYTASTDAILALISETLPGWGCTISTQGGGPDLPEAELFEWRTLSLGHEGWSFKGSHEAATPALALLAAYCRARAATTEPQI